MRRCSNRSGFFRIPTWTALPSACFSKPISFLNCSVRKLSYIIAICFELFWRNSVTVVMRTRVKNSNVRILQTTNENSMKFAISGNCRVGVQKYPRVYWPGLNGAQGQSGPFTYPKVRRGRIFKHLLALRRQLTLTLVLTHSYSGMTIGVVRTRY